MKSPLALLCTSFAFLLAALACRSSSEPKPVSPPPAAEAAASEPAASEPTASKPTAPKRAAPADEPKAPTPPTASAIQPFLPADRCGLCHSLSANSTALTSATGDDVSPHGTWQATAMANAFRDPY